MSKYGFWVIAACVLLAPAAAAHDGLHERLHRASDAIEADPADGALRLARARLHKEHEDWDAAFADLERATELGADRDALAIVRSSLLMNTGRPRAAIVVLNDLVSRRPEHAGAHTRRGRAFEAMDDPRSAAAAYRSAIDHTGAPRPRHYVDWASALAKTGNLNAAIAALDEGMADLGPLVVLQEQAIAFERNLERYDTALSRIDGILARVRRPERWLALRGDVLAECGRVDAAHAARLAALDAIHRLPRSRRTTRAVLALETKLHRHLAMPVPSADDVRLDRASGVSP